MTLANISTIVFSFYQQTPLHLAVRKSQEYTVKYLVNKGADISNKDNNGVSIWDFVTELELASSKVPKNCIPLFMHT